MRHLSMMMTALVLTVAPAVHGAGLLGSTCDINHPPTMTDFDPRRYEGLWYPTHDYMTSSYLFNVTKVEYENRYLESTLPSGDVVVHMESRATFVNKDGSCFTSFPLYEVVGGVLSRSVQRADGTVREDIMQILHTDYVSIMLFLYEVFEDGVRNDESSNLTIMVRDPRQPLTLAKVADVLLAFCGPTADSLDFFQVLDFDYDATCDASSAQ